MENLFRKYINNEVSREEFDRLMQYFDHPENRDKLTELIKEELLAKPSRELDEQTMKIVSNLDEQVLRQVKTLTIDESSAPVVKRFPYTSWASVAVLLIVVATGIFFYLDQEHNVEIIEDEQNLVDISPGRNRAILTLDGEAEIELDGNNRGLVFQKGAIHYDDGQLVTSMKARENKVIQYATLTTPNGGQYEVTLPDGSKVFLNAASSLRYPIRFAGEHRAVELSGEGYFEVVSDIHRPFLVKSHGQTVQVVGTAFNIHAYGDDDVVTTTLAEGIIEVGKNGMERAKRLAPGQQSVFDQKGFKIHQVDVSTFISWKDGRFAFDEIDLSIVLRQLERWYDVDFVYEGQMPKVAFWGSLSREVMLSEWLTVLELNTGISYKREGRKVMMEQ